MYCMRSTFVSHWSIYPKYNIHQSNSLPDIRQNHWTTKYRSVTYIYFMRSIIASQWTIIPRTTFIHLIVLKVLNKITGLKYRSLTHIYLIRSILVSHWSIIPSMTFINQIVLKKYGKITGLWNIGHWPTYILWCQSLCQTDPLSQGWHLYIT